MQLDIQDLYTSITEKTIEIHCNLQNNMYPLLRGEFNQLNIAGNHFSFLTRNSGKRRTLQVALMQPQGVQTKENCFNLWDYIYHHCYKKELTKKITDCITMTEQLFSETQMGGQQTFPERIIYPYPKHLALISTFKHFSIYPLCLRKAPFVYVDFSKTWRKELFIEDQYN